MGKRKFQRGSRKRHIVGGADFVQPPRPVDDFGRSGFIIPRRAANENARIERAANDYAHRLRRTFWQQFVERILLQQGVAPRQEEDIPVAMIECAH